jgi:type I restriction enzyme S subunit
MVVMAGYKQTEVGVIPEDWAVINASEACLKIQDGTHFSPRIGGNDYLYITSKNIRSGYLDLSTASRIDAAQHHAIYQRCDVKKGDLLLTKDGANTGNAALNTLDEEFSLLSSVAFLRFHQSRSAAYFLQQILTSPGQRRIQDAMSGNAITRLTLEKINKLRFPVPPTKAEQEAIANALSDADDLIEALEKLITKKRQIKQGAMQELLTGKKRLPGFSGDWFETSLLELALGKKELFDDGDWVESEHITTEGVRLIQTGNIGIGQYSESNVKKYIFESSFSFLHCKEVQEGDLLICRLADPAGRACVLPNIGEVKVITSVDVTIFRPPVSIANRVFLANLFSSSDWFRAVSDRSGGTTHKRISRGALGRLKIWIPEISEQTAIATILSDMDTEIAALETKLTKARQLKQGMMHNLLTGRIRLL